MNFTNLKQKITLGTVQLGLPYGINNRHGKPILEEAFNILDIAAREGITLIDSAEGYGDAINVIGGYLQQHKNAPFEVISKFIGDHETLRVKVDRTIAAIGRMPYAFMFHRFADYQSGKYIKELLTLKEEGIIERIGLSLYSERELEISLTDRSIEVIQVPLNPFDASNNKLALFRQAKLAGKEIHVRSVFLQGLFFKPAEQLTGNLRMLSPALNYFQEAVNAQGLDIRRACLNFALHQPFVDRVVIGVETPAQLEENIHAVLSEFPEELIEILRSGPTVDENLLNPSTWKP